MAAKLEVTETAGEIGEKERQLYRERGFSVVRKLFPEAEVEAFRKRFLSIVNEEVEPAPGMLVMRDVMVAKGAVVAKSKAASIAKIQDLQGDPVFFEGYMTHPRLLDLVQAYTGSDIKSIHSMLINKPPGVDGRHPLHQDLLYFPFRPADAIVATWTALEACNKENGCLVVVPGSHKGELLKHTNPDWEWLNFGYFGAASVGAHPERVHLEMEAGDTVFFHPLLLHGSGRNRSSGYRRAISAHYASATCEFMASAKPLGPGRPYLLVRGHEHSGCI